MSTKRYIPNHALTVFFIWTRIFGRKSPHPQSSHRFPPPALSILCTLLKKREVFSLSATWGISGRSCLIGESDSRINSTHALNPIPEQKKTLSLTGIQTPRGMKHNNIRLKLEMKDSFCHQASRIADLLRLYEANRSGSLNRTGWYFTKCFSILNITQLRTVFGIKTIFLTTQEAVCKV